MYEDEQQALIEEAWALRYWRKAANRVVEIPYNRHVPARKLGDRIPKKGERGAEVPW